MGRTAWLENYILFLCWYFGSITFSWQGSDTPSTLWQLSWTCRDSVHDVAICLSFAFVCSQLCVFFPSRDAYSEDSKLSPHEVWLHWWNLSTVICNSMNRWVSLLSPYSLNLRSGVWYRVFQLKECFNELNKAKFKFWIEHFREKVYWIIFSIEYSWKNDIE